MQNYLNSANDIFKHIIQRNDILLIVTYILFFKKIRFCTEQRIETILAEKQFIEFLLFSSMYVPRDSQGKLATLF